MSICMTKSQTGTLCLQLKNRTKRTIVETEKHRYLKKKTYLRKRNPCVFQLQLTQRGISNKDKMDKFQ